MSNQRIPPEGTPARPADATIGKPPVQRVVREERVVVPPGDPGVTPGAVHEEERVGVLPDGSVVREFDRIEQPPVDRRNWVPWAIAVVLLIVLAGLAIWYFARDEKATVAPVIGQTSTTAVTRLQQDGFKTQIIRRVSVAAPGDRRRRAARRGQQGRQGLPGRADRRGAADIGEGAERGGSRSGRCA